MAHAHVPAFGKWDSQDVPYTVYFDKARTAKDRGAKKINPNDPAENPGAFGGLENNNDNFNAVRAPPTPPPGNLGMKAPIAVRKEERRDREDGYISSSSVNKRNPVQQRNVSRGSTAPEYRSDMSSFDRSLNQSNNSNNLHARSNARNGLGDGSNNGFPSPSPSRVNGGTRRAGDINLPQKAASVPKFGVWDETDPTSGEGYTVIFNKVREESKTPSRLPQVPQVRPEPSPYYGHKRDNSSSKAKNGGCWPFSLF